MTRLHSSKKKIRLILSNILAIGIMVSSVLHPGSTLHILFFVIGATYSLLYRALGIGILTVLSLTIFCIPSLVILTQWYPVAVSLLLAGGSLFSFFQESTLIEQAAKWERKVSVLSPQIIVYCRRLTIVWIVFFIMNAGIATWTVLYGTKAIWSFYNGFCSYVLAATLFISERVLRKYLVDTNSTSAL